LASAIAPSSRLAYALWEKAYTLIAKFHTTYNEANLHRNPVNFFLENRLKINKIVFYILLVNSVYMLFAVYFLADIK
jgi:hypothetical protein